MKKPNSNLIPGLISSRLVCRFLPDGLVVFSTAVSQKVMGIFGIFLLDFGFTRGVPSAIENEI